MSLLAYRGKKGCTDPQCTQLGDPDADTCFGWHCGECGEPSSMQGHFGKCPSGTMNGTDHFEGGGTDDSRTR